METGSTVPSTAASDPNPTPTKTLASPPAAAAAARLLPDMDHHLQQDKEALIRLPKNALISLLVATVPVAWWSNTQPELLAWRLSLLLCCAAFLFSRLLHATVPAHTMLLVLFSGFTTALYADAALPDDPKVGVLIAHLNSHLAAGMLGYALAIHCQHVGLEVSPATVPPPPRRRKLSEERAKEIFRVKILGWFCYGMFTTGIVVRVAWVVWNRADCPTEYLGFHAFAPMAFALLLWSMFLSSLLLKDVIIGEGWLDLIVVQLFLVEVLVLLSFVVLGDVGIMVVTWLGILVWTGCFGYCLCVCNSFRLEEAKAREAASKSEVAKTIATEAVDSDMKSDSS